MSCDMRRSEVVATLYRDVTGQRWVYLEGDMSERLGPFPSFAVAVGATYHRVVEAGRDPERIDLVNSRNVIEVPT